jgi:hypothetical protein
MRYTSDDHRRYAFRDWLRAELARLDFYQRRGNRYLVSEFARYANQLDARVEEVSLGRYLREESPVLPTPESCRELARALGRHPVEVLLEAGYLLPEDFFYMSESADDAGALERQLHEIDRYEYLPEPIRAQMRAALEQRLRQIGASRLARQHLRSIPSSAGETPPTAESAASPQRAHTGSAGSARNGRQRS